MVFSSDVESLSQVVRGLSLLMRRAQARVCCRGVERGEKEKERCCLGRDTERLPEGEDLQPRSVCTNLGRKQTNKQRGRDAEAFGVQRGRSSLVSDCAVRPHRCHTTVTT